MQKTFQKIKKKAPDKSDNEFKRQELYPSIIPVKRRLNSSRQLILSPSNIKLRNQKEIKTIK